jgi:hypothetical protein
VVLPWHEWEHEVKRLKELGTSFLGEPEVLLAGTAARFLVMDPPGFG